MSCFHFYQGKKLQQQLSKMQRECVRLNNSVGEAETAQLMLKDELRKAKDASSAANLRARKAQMLQSRPSNEIARKVKASEDENVVKAVRPKSVDSEEARLKVLEMLENHDPKKMDKIDAIMERFKGRESFLLMKMAARYNNENAPVTQSKSTSKGGSSVSSKNMNTPAQKRSEMALARHMERMRNRKSERSVTPN